MRKFLFFLLLGFRLSGFSQVEPVYSQYMFNPVVINPAYVGVHDMASLYAVYRQQWLSIDLNSESFRPITSTISGQTTLPKNNIGVGFSFVHDEIGIQTTNEFNAMIGYKIPFGSKNLSFGLQGGIMSANFDYNKLDLDPDFADDIYFSGSGKGNGTLPTIGAGVLWSTRSLFLGFSVPRILQMKFEQSIDGNEEIVESSIDRNYMFTGGYVFHLGNGLKIKPSTLIRYTESAGGFSGGRVSYDINTSVLLKESIWLGASVRSFSTMSLMGQLKLSQMFATGLAWEFPIDAKDLSQIGSTFELMLNMNIAIFDVQAIQTIFY